MAEMAQRETGFWQHVNLVMREAFSDIKWARDMLIGGCISIAGLALQVSWVLIASEDWRLHKWQWIASVVLPTIAVIFINIALRVIMAPWKVYQKQERTYSENLRLANDQINSFHEEASKIEELRPKIVPVKYDKAEGRLQNGVISKKRGL